MKALVMVLVFALYGCDGGGITSSAKGNCAEWAGGTTCEVEK